MFAFACLEYTVVPKGAKANVQGGFLLLAYWGVSVAFLLPATIWAIALVVVSPVSILNKVLSTLIHGFILCVAVGAPSILIPLIDTAK